MIRHRENGYHWSEKVDTTLSGYGGWLSIFGLSFLHQKSGVRVRDTICVYGDLMYDRLKKSFIMTAPQYFAQSKKSLLRMLKSQIDMKENYLLRCLGVGVTFFLGGVFCLYKFYKGYRRRQRI